MLAEDRYFHTLTEDELWQRYCGFLDLSVDRFMEIQKGLLMDQIDRVAGSTLGKKIMGNRKPRTVDEFRQTVPLTTYDDYEPHLNNREEQALAATPHLWCHSAGRGGSFKWVPHSLEVVERAVRNYLACCILAATDTKGKVNIQPGFTLLTVLAPVPYTSGSVITALTELFSMRVIPPPHEAATTGFRERIKGGFQTALRDGADVIGALAGILVRMGEEFSNQTRGLRLSASMLHPKVLGRLARAWLKAKAEGRHMLPKDLWRPKGILVSGVDTAIYREAVAHYWGSIPYELYTGTEGFVYAVQSWRKNGLVFVPDMVFLEFLPYDEHGQRDDHPATVLLDGLEEGKLYEVIITHFYGMPLLRYRLNDVVRVISLADEEAGIGLPHVAFQRRAGETINIANLAQLDEKTLWQAIANTGLSPVDWVACKEYDRGQPCLRVYMELAAERDTAEIEAMIDQQLKVVDTDYKDIDSYLDLQPVRVSLLSPGTFQRYSEEKRKEGASLARLQPPHVNPPDMVVERLLQLSNQAMESNA